MSRAYAYQVQSEFNNLGDYVEQVKSDLTEERMGLRLKFAD